MKSNTLHHLDTWIVLHVSLLFQNKLKFTIVVFWPVFCMTPIFGQELSKVHVSNKVTDGKWTVRAVNSAYEHPVALSALPTLLDSLFCDPITDIPTYDPLRPTLYQLEKILLFVTGFNYV